jgi:hypothetical protein
MTPGRGAREQPQYGPNRYFMLVRLGTWQRVGTENPVTLCDLCVLADQAAEPAPP